MNAHTYVCMYSHTCCVSDNPEVHCFLCVNESFVCDIATTNCNSCRTYIASGICLGVRFLLFSVSICSFVCLCVCKYA